MGDGRNRDAGSERREDGTLERIYEQVAGVWQDIATYIYDSPRKDQARLEYHASGRVKSRSTTHKDGTRADYGYDESGRRTSISYTLPGGRTERWDLDVDGSPKSHTASKFDSTGNLRSEQTIYKDESKRKAEYDYDARGQLKWLDITERDGTRNIERYDSSGRLVAAATIHQDGTRERKEYSYYDSGKVKSEKSQRRDGTMEKIEYHESGQPKSVDIARRDKSKESQQYDDSGKLVATEFTSKEGAKQRVAYDATGKAAGEPMDRNPNGDRGLSETSSNDMGLGVVAAGMGELLQQSDNSAGINEAAEIEVIDPAPDPVVERDDSGNVQSSITTFQDGTTRSEHYERDSAGRVLVRDIKDRDGSWVREENEFDADGKIKVITQVDSKGTRTRTEFDPDTKPVLVEITSPDGKTRRLLPNNDGALVEEGATGASDADTSVVNEDPAKPDA